jgi:hypothetical protein
MEANQNKPSEADEISEKRFVLIDETVAKFSQRVLNREAWFRSANELVYAMKLLEPKVQDFWKCHASSAGISDDENSEPGPEHSLIDVHLMLAAFAIENLCKGYLADRLNPEELKEVTGGELPKTLKGTHGILAFVEQTEMRISGRDKALLERIQEAVWRGRYPIPNYHKKL